MSGGAGRKVVAGVVIGALIGAALKALRGDPAPQFAGHPTAEGGPRPPEAPATEPADEPELVVQATLLPVADVAADEPPAPALAAWVAPVDGACPEGYPVKAKLKSGLFHLPGMFAYDRTNPDRCYATAEAAEADGLRAAKR